MYNYPGMLSAMYCKFKDAPVISMFSKVDHNVLAAPPYGRPPSFGGFPGGSAPPGMGPPLGMGKL